MDKQMIQNVKTLEGWTGKLIQRKPSTQQNVEQAEKIPYSKFLGPVMVLSAVTPEGIYVNNPRFPQIRMAYFLPKKWIDGNWELVSA